MTNSITSKISEETLAAWLDNMMSEAETTEFMKEFGNEPLLSEVLDANDDVVETYENMIEEGYDIPIELDQDFELPHIPDIEYQDDLELFSDNTWITSDYSDKYDLRDTNISDDINESISDSIRENLDPQISENCFSNENENIQTLEESEDSDPFEMENDFLF